MILSTNGKYKLSWCLLGLNVYSILNSDAKLWLEVAFIGHGEMVQKYHTSGQFGRKTSLLVELKKRKKEQLMSTVVLIDKKTKEIMQTVETTRVQWTIDQLMRNRDPQKFIARKG